MELLMKNIHMCRQGKQAGLPVTLEEDFNVPDVRPDVEQIIQSKERIVVEQTRAENGKVVTAGFLEVSILYMDDTKDRQLHRLDTKLPFDERIAMEGLEQGETVRLSCTAEDVNVALINSRKLSVRAVLGFEASVEEIYDMSAAADIRSDVLVIKQRRKLEMMQIEVQKKDILRLKEEAVIPSGSRISGKSCGKISSCAAAGRYSARRSFQCRENYLCSFCIVGTTRREVCSGASRHFRLRGSWSAAAAARK